MPPRKRPAPSSDNNNVSAQSSSARKRPARSTPANAPEEQSNPLTVNSIQENNATMNATAEGSSSVPQGNPTISLSSDVLAAIYTADAEAMESMSSPAPQAASGSTNPTQVVEESVHTVVQQLTGEVTTQDQPAISTAVAEAMESMSSPAPQAASGSTNPTQVVEESVHTVVQQLTGEVTTQDQPAISTAVAEAMESMSSPAPQAATGSTNPTQVVEESVHTVVQQVTGEVTTQDQPDQTNTMIYIYGTVRTMIAGGLPVAWAAGSAYLLHRHRDDPEKVIKLVTGAIIPSLVATGAVVHKLLPGSFQIMVEIRSLDALDEIWKSYIEGDMKKNLEKVIVTDALRCLAPEDAVNVDISLKISEDDYRKTRDNLLECALRNYVEACRGSSATFEETPTISTHVQNVGLYLEDKGKQTKPNVFEPGKIEWKVIKKLLTKARDGSVIDGNITLDISDPIDAIVHTLVETSANLNVQDTKGKTPLIFAMEERRYVLVEMLVKAGANVNLVGEHSKTPLVYAVKSGNNEVTQVLIEAGANANAVDKHSRTPLMYATESGNTKVAKLLIEAGANVNPEDRLHGKTPLMYAVQSSNNEVAQALIEAGANVNAQEKHFGQTPLMYTRLNEMVTLLIKTGANVNAADKDSKTPLMYYTKSGNKKEAKLLIEAGAKVNAADRLHGKTPLMYALEAEKERFDEDFDRFAYMSVEKFKSLFWYSYIGKQQNLIELVKYLVKAGADVNVRDGRGKTALMYAVDIWVYVRHYLRILKTPLMYTNEVAKPLLEVLIEAGAVVNVEDAQGMTALMHAKDSEVDFVRKLEKIKLGKVVSRFDTKYSLPQERSMSALDVCSEKNIVRKLDNIGFGDDGKDLHELKTSLMHAAAAIKSEIVEVLKKAGAEKRGKQELMSADITKTVSQT